MQEFQRLRQILARIEAGLGQRLDVETLAAEAGYSRWHFQRLFAALTGMSPAGYVRARRLSEAARELAASDERILVLALRYGFESQAAFSRAFRQYFGLPPGAARRLGQPLRLQEPLQISSGFSGGTMLQPYLLQEPARTVAGFSARFVSAMAPDADNLQVIPALWARFSPYLTRLPLADSALTLGVIDCRDASGGLTYLACAPVLHPAQLPQELEVRHLPGGLYARFTHSGPLAEIGDTMRRIYTEWLPQSEYRLDDRPELEHYDGRFRPDLGQTVFDVLIPVKRK